MAQSVVKTQGATFSIGTTTAADDATEYAADTYKAVAEIEDLGELGDSFDEIVRRNVNASRVTRLKGQKDGGTLTLVVSRVGDDEGQLALIDAAEDNANAADYNFRVVLDDAPSGGTPTTFYFRACVMGMRTSFGEANNIIRLTFPLAVNSDVLEIPAAAA